MTAPSGWAEYKKQNIRGDKKVNAWHTDDNFQAMARQDQGKKKTMRFFTIPFF